MALWTWWPGDPLGPLAQPDDFVATPSADRAELVALTGLPGEEIEARLGAGHRCSVAYLGSVAAAYGWVAAAEASIGELDVSFRLAGADRYLWDFRTLPAWRGRGLYPRLLRGILRSEGVDEARFWIINAPENLASARGIQKAGFRVAGDLAFAQDGRAGLVPATGPDRAAVGAGLLGGAADPGRGQRRRVAVLVLHHRGPGRGRTGGVLAHRHAAGDAVLLRTTRRPGGSASDSTVSLSEEALAHMGRAARSSLANSARYRSPASVRNRRTNGSRHGGFKGGPWWRSC